VLRYAVGRQRYSRTPIHSTGWRFAFFRTPQDNPRKGLRSSPRCNFQLLPATSRQWKSHSVRCSARALVMTTPWSNLRGSFQGMVKTRSAPTMPRWVRKMLRGGAESGKRGPIEPGYVRLVRCGWRAASPSRWPHCPAPFAGGSCDRQIPTRAQGPQIRAGRA
jgi:hypothetical protein